MKIYLYLAVIIIILFSGFLLDQKLNISAKVSSIGSSPTEAVRNLVQIVRKDGLYATLEKIKNKLSSDPRLGLGYSLQDIDSYPAIEDQEERSKYPINKIVKAVDISNINVSEDLYFEDDTWKRSNGGNYSNKFSSIDQININNIKSLDLVWHYSSEPSKVMNHIETNPIYGGGWLFFVTVNDELICMNPRTGEVKWSKRLPGPVARRGLIWEENEDFSLSRLFVPTSRGVFSIFAETGEIQTDFGDNGQVGNQLSLIPPVITKDKKLIVALIKPSIEAYDLDSGKKIWSTSLISKEEATLLTGSVPWGGMSYDPARKQLYVATGNPRPEVIGVSRPGNNTLSCSIVSIDTLTGDIVWDFQEVTHDLWDFDIASAPILTKIVRDEKTIDVVATVTKRGNTILLDRDLGRPIFDFKYTRTPTSEIPGEKTSPYQPEFDLPEPFLKRSFEFDDISDISEEAQASILRKIKNAEYGFFTPPMIGKDIVVYGVGGGANWPGASVDPRTGILYVASSQVPWLIRVGYKDLKSRTRDTSGIEGHSFYQEKCSSCHGISRDGVPYDDIKKNLEFVPSLIGLSFMKEYEYLISKNKFDSLHSFYSIKASQEDLDLAYSYFSELDKKADNEKVIGINGYWRRLIDVDGNPGSKPPWGFLTAIDLNLGITKWKIPFSKTILKNGQIIDGEENLGSVITTAGDLIFITGSTDNKIKALNITNGDELWSYTLPQKGSATPMTFDDNGVQYLVITASGIIKNSPSMSQDHILAFKIFNPQSKELGTIPIKTSSSVATNDLSLFGTDSKVGKELYSMSCASCHDSGVAKAPVVGSVSDWTDRLSYGKDRLYKNSIQGYSGTNGYMPAKGGADYLSDEQVRIAVDYMIGLSR